MRRQIFEGGAVDVELDQLFDVLAHERRRHVLSCLVERERPMAQSDLADEIAFRENAGETRPSRAEVATVYRSLHHVHVPKLADAGLVEYDPDTNTVKLVTEVRPLWKQMKRLAPR